MCDEKIRKATEYFASQINKDDDATTSTTTTTSPDLLVNYFEDYALPKPIRMSEQPDSPLNYNSVADLNAELEQKTVSDLFVLHFNIVSLVAHIDSIKSMISEMKKTPDIICFSESRLKDKKIDWQSALVWIEGYTLKYDNSKTSAGGVAIYVCDRLNINVKRNLKLKGDDCESL